MTNQQVKNLLLDNFEVIGSFVIKKGVVDVKGDVRAQANIALTTLPFKFGSISGDLDLSMTLLTTLKGCPDNIGGSLVLASMPRLNSLEGFPSYIGRDCNLTDNPELQSLQALHSEIGGTLIAFYGKHNLEQLDISQCRIHKIRCPVLPPLSVTALQCLLHAKTVIDAGVTIPLHDAINAFSRNGDWLAVQEVLQDYPEYAALQTQAVEPTITADFSL